MGGVKLRIAVCEDEKNQQEKIQEMIVEWKNQTRCTLTTNFFTSGEQFLSSWESGVSYDIVFLDIHLDGMDGMKLARRIREQDESVLLVFITTRIEYVLKGYEVNAWRYLIKPVHKSEFLLCLNKGKELSDREQQTLILYNNNHYYKVSYDDIIYIESFGHTVEIHTKVRNYEMRIGISQLKEKLPSQFFRSHRSYIINLMYVNEVESQRVRVDDAWIPLSLKNKEELLNQMNSRVL